VFICKYQIRWQPTSGMLWITVHQGISICTCPGRECSSGRCPGGNWLFGSFPNICLWLHFVKLHSYKTTLHSTWKIDEMLYQLHRLCCARWTNKLQNIMNHPICCNKHPESLTRYKSKFCSIAAGGLFCPRPNILVRQ